MSKASEEDATTEFEHCWMKLHCPHTPAAGDKEVYCWTNPHDPLKWCQWLERIEVLLWARYMVCYYLCLYYCDTYKPLEEWRC